MKYLTVTTKHHDGFCLFDSKSTRFTSVHTPYKNDIIGLLSQACHKRKLPLCLYYSIADWNHPNYPNQGRHHELAKPEEGDQGLRIKFQKPGFSSCTNFNKCHQVEDGPQTG